MQQELFSYPEMLKRAVRQVRRRTVHGYPKGFTRFDRFTSTFAPNLVYRGLGRIDRGDGLAAVVRDPATRASDRTEPGELRQAEPALIPALLDAEAEVELPHRAQKYPFFLLFTKAP